MKKESTDPTSQLSSSVTGLANALQSNFPAVSISERALSNILMDALGTGRVIDDLSELFRIPRDQVAQTLSKLGVSVSSSSQPTPTAGANGVTDWICSPNGLGETFSLRIQASSPTFAEPFLGRAELVDQLDKEWSRLVDKVHAPDPFLAYFRENLSDYVDTYVKDQSIVIHKFVDDHFGQGGPRYLVTVGIGANEQFWHYPQRWYMQQHQKGTDWFICDNPKDIAALPADASSRNTLFLEYSRSGKTQEIVKVNEFLPPDAIRIVFANTGPLHELAMKDSDHCLICSTPDEIPGRFGKNLTSMILAPFDLLSLPFKEYWAKIEECIRSWDLTDIASPPAALARYLRAAQLIHGANHIYFGTNDNILQGASDEFVQFWNEGVNKDGNDLSVSRYFGLPRDSHLNIEGILGNRSTKTAIFLLRRDSDELFQHPLRNPKPAFINPAHNGLTIADVDYALAKANADHFGSIMPTITIELDRPTLLDSAVISQLWTDTVYCYALLVGVNPGSNPEVRHVRDRSDSLLADFGRSKAG